MLGLIVSRRLLLGVRQVNSVDPITDKTPFLTDDQTWIVDVPESGTIGKSITIVLKPQVASGRHILVLRNTDSRGVEAVDAFLALDVE